MKKRPGDAGLFLFSPSRSKPLFPANKYVEMQVGRIAGGRLRLEWWMTKIFAAASNASGPMLVSSLYRLVGTGACEAFTDDLTP